MATVQLTDHFTLEEFTASDTADACGIDNSPDADAQDELQALAETMEDVRTLLGDNPVTITSGFRCSALNNECGGAADSAHLYGRACDFVVPGFGSPLDICRELQAHMVDLGIDQLIYECGTDMTGDEWVHLALAPEGETPRCEALTITTGGTTTGFA